MQNATMKQGANEYITELSDSRKIGFIISKVNKIKSRESIDKI